MCASEREPGDDRNVTFELEEIAFEELKPGFAYPAELDAEAESRMREDGDDRQRLSEERKVPQAPLAERIRQREKGG